MQSLRDRMPFRSLRQRRYIPKPRVAAAAHPGGETSSTNIYPEGYTRSPYLDGLRNRRMAALCNPVGVMARWLFAICSPFANFGMQSLRDRMPFRSLRQRGYIPKGETSTTNIHPKGTPLTPKGFDRKAPWAEEPTPSPLPRRGLIAKPRVAKRTLGGSGSGGIHPRPYPEGV